MLLRDHPLLTYRGVPSWPPTWTWVGGLDNQQSRGEIGILHTTLQAQSSVGRRSNNAVFAVNMTEEEPPKPPPDEDESKPPIKEPPIEEPPVKEPPPKNS